MTDSGTDESLIEFPCAFPIKVMGKDPERMREVLAEVLTRHAQPPDPAEMTAKGSRTGRFTSITVMVQAQNKAQLDSIYQDLTDSAHIMIAL